MTRASSRTAELMAVQRGLESLRPARSRLFCDPLCNRFVSTRWRIILAASHIPGVRRLVEAAYDRVGGPGPRASAVVRTRLIDDLLLRESQSAAQLVILGAGFDSRPYRLSPLEHLSMFEVDQPRTQQVKREGLRAIHTPPNVHFVPVDFEHDDLAAALAAAQYEHDSPSIFLWEGVTNYLTPTAVDATLHAVRSLASENDLLIFTYVDRAVIDGDVDAFPEARRWIEGVKRRGEPWTFGLSPAEVPNFLANRGFALEQDISTAVAGEQYFKALGRPERGSALYRVVAARAGLARPDQGGDLQ
jgi:methyltransferase (TIGR00027 family)